MYIFYACSACCQSVVNFRDCTLSLTNLTLQKEAIITTMKNRHAPQISYTLEINIPNACVLWCRLNSIFLISQESEKRISCNSFFNFHFFLKLEK